MAAPPEHPHDPRPPALVLPSFAMLWRGLAFGAIGLASAAIGVAMFRRSLLLAPGSLAMLLVALDSFWAGVIHLTGGEWFDDHPDI